MPIHARRVPGGYVATATSSTSAGESWMSERPYEAEELVRKLAQMGHHMQDAVDAVYLADLEWGRARAGGTEVEEVGLRIGKMASEIRVAGSAEALATLAGLATSVIGILSIHIASTASHSELSALRGVEIRRNSNDALHVSAESGRLVLAGNAHSLDLFSRSVKYFAGSAPPSWRFTYPETLADGSLSLTLERLDSR
jgi:hypothetical protein